MSERPPPRPLWSSTSTTSPSATITSTTTRMSVSTSGNLLSAVRPGSRLPPADLHSGSGGPSRWLPRPDSRTGRSRSAHALAIATNLSASRLAPPTSSPSTSGQASSSPALSGVTEPPYWTRIDRDDVAAEPAAARHGSSPPSPGRPPRSRSARSRSPRSARRRRRSTREPPGRGPGARRRAGRPPSTAAGPASRSVERLADAEDRRHRVAEHRVELSLDDLVGLAEELRDARSARRSRSGR